MACTLIVRVKDKFFTDPDWVHLNRVKTQLGDVISVLPYGQSGGKKVDASDQWKTVDCPDMTMAEADLLMQMPDVRPGDLRFQRRVLSLDIDNLSAAKKTEMTTNLEERGTLSKTEIRAVRKDRVSRA